jgi:hypothetical protein
MKILCCWRCQQEVPMLEGEEGRRAYELYSLGFKTAGDTLAERRKALIDYYQEVTGVYMDRLVKGAGSPTERQRQVFARHVVISALFLMTDYQ